MCRNTATMQSFTLGARIRAARYLKGLGSVDALADAIDSRGLGRTKLYGYEQDKKVPLYRELVDIANACEMPIEFFTADFGRLSEISDEPRLVIAQARHAWEAEERVVRDLESLLDAEDRPQSDEEDTGEDATGSD